MKTMMEDTVLTSLEKQRLVVNETSDKVDYLQSKVITIEKHLQHSWWLHRTRHPNLRPNGFTRCPALSP